MKQDEGISDKSVRLKVDSSVNIGRRLKRIRMINFLMGVVQQQRTTAVILIRCGQESGAIQ